MSTSLFYLNGAEACVATQSNYEKEVDLQKLVADNPNLILRDSEKGVIDLFLIKREQGVKKSADGSEVYSLDHLMVDTDAVPVLVEVKCSSDTRIRREVVGQMMDYAARASFWKVNELRENFESTTPDFDPEIFNDVFWETVATNLKAERMKLVFVADHIPAELRTMIEFMSRNLNDIDVYGVEIVRYKSGDTTFLTTDVIENALKAERRAIATAESQWTFETLSAQIKERSSEAGVAAFQKIVKLCESLGLKCRYGKGAKNGTFSVYADKKVFFMIGSISDVIGLEFKVPRVAQWCGEGWAEDFVFLLKSNTADARIWCPGQYCYIDLQSFANPKNMAALKALVEKVASLSN